jgi:MFS family permease
MGRLPFAVVPLSVILLMREEGYHYGQVGAVVGAEALAVGLTAGFVGRLVDRVGRRQVILVTGAMTALVLCGQTASILANAPVWLLVTLAALQGATIPPISASMRALWARLVPEERLESAYAFDAIQLELVFVLGPLIAAGLATALSPAVGLFLSAGCYAVAALGFATAPAAAAVGPEEQVQRTRLGPLSSPGMRTLLFAGAVTAVSFGALEVALPAFAEAEGSRGAVGPLITVWALGSLIGGLWYGGRSWSSPPEKRFLVLMGLLVLGSAPLPFAPSIGAMGFVLLLTGMAIAPLTTVEYALVDRLAPPGTETEAYSWQIVAVVMGAAAGSLVAGLLIEKASLEWALATAGIACAAGFLVALARRRSLRAAPATSTTAV